MEKILKKVSLKVYKIKGIQKLRKDEVLEKLTEYHSIRKIQRFIRNKFSCGQLFCPLTQEPPNYPFYVYKPTKSRYFIYYNLETLANYIISSGSFIDPKTRIAYDRKDLSLMDKLLHENKIKIYRENVICTVMKSFRDKKYYIIKKDIENDIRNIEACIDEVAFIIKQNLEGDASIPMKEIRYVYIYNLSKYFKYLEELTSVDNSKDILLRYINSLSSVKNSRKKEDSIHLLYQLYYNMD